MSLSSDLVSHSDNKLNTDAKKVVEARTAILLLNRHNNASQNMWFLKHMFRPIQIGRYDEFQLLHLSSNIKPVWERKRKELLQQNESHLKTRLSVAANESANLHETSDAEQAYILTGRTRILNIVKDHCLVFMIDMSSSLATTGTNNGNILIENAFAVIENILRGLIRPFALSLSDSASPTVIEQTIRITVITECSQFGSNMNVIPILAEYPTMRVLMQNVQVSQSNIQAVLKSLKEGIDTFEKDLAISRKKLIMKRLKMGYELDVRDNHAQSMTDSTESRFSTVESSSTSSNSNRSINSRKASLPGTLASRPSIHHQYKNQKSSAGQSKHSQKKLFSHSSKRSSHPAMSTNATQSRSHAHHESSSSLSSITKVQENNTVAQSKDTWGVGKTGSTLSYILRAALFALELLPENAQPSIILLTDGVVKSNIQDEAVVQEMVAKNVACNVVQLGKNGSFFPGFNFGFVPDNEILEFVASTTNGVFTFSEYCTPVVDEYDETNMAMPNIYHYRYLLKETILDSRSLRNAKSKESRTSRLNESQDSSSSRIEIIPTNLGRMELSAANSNGFMHQSDRKAFPWDPMAKPIIEESGRLKFKEYFLSSECWHFIHARLRQGFVLQSLSFVDELRPSSSKSSSMINRQLSSELQTNVQKKQTILIILVLRWQPNISVHYSIKSLWTSSLHAYLNSISSLYDDMHNILEEPHVFEDESMFNHMRAPKVDIIVKSTSTFSHMLHNWDAFQRRNQMMAVQGGNMTIDLANAPGLIKVGKMKRLLERIAESDAMLKQLVQFNFSDKNNISVPPNQFASANLTEWAAQLSYVQKFSAHWAKLERSDLRIFNMCWYDEHTFNLILETEQCTPALDEPQRTSVEEANEAQTDVDQIYTKLEKWATFMSEDQQAFIKLLNLDKVSKTVSNFENTKRTNPTHPVNGSPKRHIIPQFCEVRVLKETERLYQVRIMFFDTNAKSCRNIVQELCSLLDTQSQYQKALANLEIRDPASDTYTNSFENDNEKYAESFVDMRVSKKPISLLLMRDNMHFLPTNGAETQLTKSNTNNKSIWHARSKTSLTGEFIVKNYLNRCTWHWDIQDLYQEKHPYTTFLTPLIDLAFGLIMSLQTMQGWTLLSSSKSFGHFYKEVNFSYDNDCVYSCQYFVWRDASKKRISTELWCEPVVSSETVLKVYKDLQVDIFNKDKQIISQLITFDVLYSFAARISPSINDALAAHMQIEDEMRGSVKWMQRTVTFNIPSVLKKSKLLFAVYPCPKYHQHYIPKTQQDGYQEYKVAMSSNIQEQKEQGSVATETSTNPLPSLRGRRNNMSFSTNSTSGGRSRTISKFSPIGSPLPSSLKTPPLWQTKKSTECTCTRPDDLFASEKDNISKLRSAFRDVALLHYYFEQSLATVTDQTISLAKSSSNEFWSGLVNKLFNSKEMHAKNCTLCVAHNFRDLRCFIKVFDPSMFIILLVPRLDAVVKGLLKLERNGRAENDNFSFESISLTMFECRRHVHHYQQDHNIEITSMDPLSYKEWYESLSNTSRPKLACGPGSIHSPLSDRALRMMQDVTRVYSRSIVKSIFTCLLYGRAVSSGDFAKVLEICDETNIDINLTEYLNVQALLKHRSRTNREELIEANQRFISVLGHHFEPVVISDGKWNNVYCYRPPFAKPGQKLGLPLSTSEKPSNLTDVVLYAQNPLFVRLELSLKRTRESGIGSDCITVPVNSLPTSYNVKTDDGMSFDFEPESIGTTFSPVESADGTSATLHLVCMSLPQSEHDPPDIAATHQATCPAENTAHRQTTFLDIDKLHCARLSSLSQDKQDALIETESRLNWLFAEEIMHGLLRSGPITQNVVRYVEAQLRKKNPFVDFPTNTSIPLAFVKNQRESRRMFLEELEKFSNSLYRLIRTGNCFYACDNGSLRNLKHHNNEEVLSNDDTKSDCNSLFDGEGLNITTKSDYEDEEQEDDEFCQGLGISILESEISGDANYQNEIHETTEPQLYWLLLIPQAQSVQIYFYSKSQQFVDRSEIIRVTKSMVNDAINKTNTLSLLKSLNDTRICSKYLLSSIEEDKSLYSSYDESSEEESFSYDTATSNNNLVEMLSTSGEENTLNPPKKFLPGQFSCDVVYMKRFPLHWRISPNAAYNKLMTDTLPPFLVRNKQGMFVCSHGDSVLYFFLYEANTNLQQNGSAPSEQNNQYCVNTSNNHDESSVPMNPDSPYSSFVMNINAHDSDVLATSQSTRVRYPSYTHNKSSPQGSIASQQISPSHSPSINDISASASSPISGRRYNARHHESRELVLEVHGVKIDYYIIDGLVDMIDSRITSEITLKEVQQFLVRNPGSRLSRADINFIMPVEKEPSFRHKLKIPSIINNTAHFLKILRKNVLSEASIHLLHSSDAPLFVKRHHEMRYSPLNESEHSRTLYENGQRLPLEDWLFTDLLFYYNHLNRAPGTNMPFEQRIGEGVAGICLSVLDSSETAYSKIISSHLGHGTNGQHSQINLPTIQQCLASDFEDTNVDSKFALAIDIWTCCKIELTFIYQHIQKALTQSVCDYIVESTISNSIHLSKHQQEVEGFDSLAKALLYTLDKATEWQSSIAKKISHNIQLAPWYFENIISQMKAELVEIHPLLEPMIAKAEIKTEMFMNEDQEQDLKYVLTTDNAESNIFFQERDASSFINQSSNTNKYGARSKTKKKKATPLRNQTSNATAKKNAKPQRYIIFGGISELYGRFMSPALQNIRRGSVDIVESPNLKTFNRNLMYFSSSSNINPIGEDDTHHAYYPNDSQKREDSASLHSRQESLASSASKAFPNYILKQKIHSPEQKDTPHQHSFVMLILDPSKLSVYTYNCSEQLVDYVYNTAYRIVFQQETRHMALNNILHQKMGLFNHSSSMSEILSRSCQEVEPASVYPLVANSTGSLLHHNAISQVQSVINNNNRPSVSPSLANTIGRLTQTESVSSIPTVNSMERRSSNNNNVSAKPTGFIADFESLQHLIRGTSDQKNRLSIARTFRNNFEKPMPLSTSDIHENSKLCAMTRTTSDPAFVSSQLINPDRVLSDTYSESISRKGVRYSTDHLLNHGKPYLDSFLAQSRPLIAHEKAFKVYTKWADQYYGPGHFKEVDEMMTFDELKQILKASRLLHFCRTPLIFSESSFALDNVDTNLKKPLRNLKADSNQEMVAWYEQLARNFTKEYASYLESIGMHLIVYGPSNSQDDEANAYLSRFKVTENCFVNSPVVYLLQVFEGGSIMCEVRLTGVFVSVTLYTLHRRYGGLKHSSRFRYQQNNIGRERFQSFMNECDRFKQQIRVHSFIFDFQLRQIQRSLDDIDSFPSSLSLLDIIRNTVSIYNQPTIHSHNCIASGIYKFPLKKEPAQGLIPWMLNHGEAFDMKVLKANKIPTALFVSSNNLMFDSENFSLDKKETVLTYTLIVCPKKQMDDTEESSDAGVYQYNSSNLPSLNSTKDPVQSMAKSSQNETSQSPCLYLQYFVLVTCNFKDDRNSEKVSVLEQHTLNDLLMSAKLKLELTMKKVLDLYQREVDWSKLYEAVCLVPQKIMPDEIVQLATKFDPYNLTAIDSTFYEVFQLKGIDWDSILDDLKVFYKMNSGDVLVEKTRHVLLFVPDTALPVLFHFIRAPDKTCTATINSKSPSTLMHQLNDNERAYITTLATTLAFCIWKYIC